MKIYISWSSVGRFTIKTCRVDCHIVDAPYIQAGVNSLEISQSSSIVKHTVIGIPGKILTRFIGWLAFLFKSFVL